MVKPQSTSRFARPKGHTRQIVDVVFGVADRNCAGFGICKIEPNGQATATACEGRWVSAELYPATPTGVGLWISKDLISPRAMENYFYFDYFVMEEDYTIPREIWQRYGEEQIIEKGYYPIIRHNGHIQIIFSPDNNSLSTL
ncbi:MAG: hypothetical protein ACI81P_000937 [Neolewinella sp.]|jgi:hypothetical protein